ncbi:VOC family protein [Microbacterium trichothecenolyticum]|uniref:VOC domain-containing protein n=1 Tax=Microbacterium trichothecenolyticum TaxID=69370 RepID=A0ABU0TUD7_MICTR|nr:VOC family protein [Microbacterium trichothecenolyticum]MDQ1123278.1 hypothetical protein [Microbacterium trichothecenolyticum]
MTLDHLDHLVFAGPSLVDAVDEIERLTGVRAAAGGRHTTTGTANALIALTVGGETGRRYLEIIGPDADAGRTASDIPTFGIRDLDAPRLAGFALRPDDLDATVARLRELGVDPGDVEPLGRRRPDGVELAWRLTRQAGNAWNGLPFLIDWLDSPHPGLGDLPRLELESFRVTAPAEDPLFAALTALGLEPGVGASSLRVELGGTRHTVLATE